MIVTLSTEHALVLLRNRDPHYIQSPRFGCVSDEVSTHLLMGRRHQSSQGMLLQGRKSQSQETQDSRLKTDCFNGTVGIAFIGMCGLR